MYHMLPCLTTTAGVSYQHCTEREELVQLVVSKKQADIAKAASAAPSAPTTPAGWNLVTAADIGIEERPDPFDMCQWRHMALFYKAEADEMADGRTPEVIATYKAAVAAAKENDDELYGCLAAWNAVRVVMNGSKSWLVGEVLQMLDYAASCELKGKTWKGYELLIQSRVKVMKKPLRDWFKVSWLCQLGCDPDPWILISGRQADELPLTHVCCCALLWC